MFESIAENIVDQLGEVTYILPQAIVIVAALLSPLLFFLTKKGVIPAAISFLIVVASAAFTALASWATL